YHVAVIDTGKHQTTTVGMALKGSGVASVPTPSGSPAKLGVGPSSATSVDCFGSSVAYPKITISNTGGQTLNWAASTTVPSASLNPSGGSIAPGSSQQVSVSQGGPTSTATKVNIPSNGGIATVSFTCIPPRPNLRVTHNQTMTQSCTPTAPSYAVTLDN